VALVVSSAFAVSSEFKMHDVNDSLSARAPNTAVISLPTGGRLIIANSVLIRW
jgi:hypothetical protein